VIGNGIKVRLAAFLVLSAVGIVYIGGSYLGIVDAILGRGYTFAVHLPGSGGLYEGSEVTYRGVKVGEVSSMSPDRKGVTLQLSMVDSAKIPKDSPMYVHNGSAVGEQYLDFEPPNNNGPYARPGDVLVGNRSSLPVQEQTLILDLDKFVGSVNRADLRTSVKELGALFRNTGHPLQRMIDSGNRFINTAKANEAQTFALFRDGQTVLRTQNRQSRNIRLLADGLAKVTRTLSRSDSNLRITLEGGASSARELNSLLTGLKPTLPVLLSNLVTVNQVTTVRITALEQLLVTYPRVIGSGFSGVDKNGYGHVSLQMHPFAPQDCSKGYLPPSRWRAGDVMKDGSIYTKAHCAEGPPVDMRGNKYAPHYPSPNGSNRVAPYNPRTGVVGMGAGSPGLRIGGQGGEQQIFGGDSWKWMLIGPLERR
jgi:phospholipid/cholesterol/gamma-HCH transport system substrate-binding protein